MNDSEAIRLTFSTNLKYHMYTKGITQKDIMRDLSVPSATISSWVNGKRLPRMEKIKELANYLHVTPAMLLGEVVFGSFMTANEAEDMEQILKENPAYPFMFDDKGALLFYYDKLNEDGKKEATKRVEELAYIPKYSKQKKDK